MPPRPSPFGSKRTWVDLAVDTASRHGPPELLRIEAAKTRRAIDVGDESGTFYVPRLYESEPDQGVLVFERIQAYQPLASLFLNQDPRLPDLLLRAGEALAVVHQRLQLPSELKAALPACWVPPQARSCFLHGDFTVWNVGVDVATNRLVVLDWEAPWFVAPRATFGPPEFDLVWFMIGLFLLRRPRRPARRHAGWAADILAESYMGANPSGLQSEVFLALRSQALHTFRPLNVIRRMRAGGVTLPKALMRYLLDIPSLWRWRRYTPSVFNASP